MADEFSHLAVLTIAEHGDAREREIWPEVAKNLSNYETFWRQVIVLLTNRIVPNVASRAEWIRLRPEIPCDYERLAMHNYSLLYHMAIARRLVEEDRKRLCARVYTRPEQIFFTMVCCIEQIKPLEEVARKILRGIGIERPRFPKHPQSMVEKIRAYRNAFAHDPVLGRALDQGRELLPPADRLPKRRNDSPLLWRDAAAIPASEMIDGLELANDLWRQLSDFLQSLWDCMERYFVEAREYSKFLSDLELRKLIPIRCNAIATLGNIVVRSDTQVIQRK